MSTTRLKELLTNNTLLIRTKSIGSVNRFRITAETYLTVNLSLAVPIFLRMHVGMLMFLVDLILCITLSSQKPRTQQTPPSPTHCPVESAGHLSLSYEERIDGIISHEGVVLVAQRSEVSLFGYSGTTSPQLEKIGSFPGTPDDSGYLRGAELVNEDSFVYCGRWRCR